MSEQQEGMEQMAARFRGETGATGERGEKGSSRLPARVAWSLVVLFVIAVVIGASAWVISSHENAVNDRKWCQVMDTLVSQRPPSGSAAANPSRGYEQRLYDDFVRLKPSLGCK